jgi:hypothetical protein
MALQKLQIQKVNGKPSVLAMNDGKLHLVYSSRELRKACLVMTSLRNQTLHLESAPIVVDALRKNGTIAYRLSK